MALTLHRRHLEGCSGSHKANSRSYETDELRRSWKNCHCPIYAGGTLGGRFRRKNTEAMSWEEARNITQKWWDAGTRDLTPRPAPTPTSPVITPAEEERDNRLTIAATTEAFLANRQGRSIKEPTLRKYRTLAKQILVFAAGRGYIMLGPVHTKNNFG